MSPHTEHEDPRYQLGVISGKIDLLLIQNAEAARQNDKRFNKLEDGQADHDARITSLEQGRSWVLGAAATITATAGAIATYLGLRQ